MPLVFVPHQYSVVIGKGRDARDAPGTRFLRAEIQSKLHLYKTCTGRLERAQIVSDLLTEQQRRCPQGGVFVKFDGERWWELSEHDARENITAAFRNRLHEKYTSSSKFKSAKRRMQLKTSSAARQKESEDNDQAGDSAVPLVVVQEEDEQVRVGDRVRQGSPSTRSGSPRSQTAVLKKTYPWCKNTNKIDVAEPRPGRRLGSYYEENKEAGVINGDRMINCMTSKTKAARLTTTTRLVGFLPPLITDVVKEEEEDHPHEEDCTSIASCSSSSSSAHHEENASLDSHRSITSSTSSDHDVRPFLPSSSSLISRTKVHRLVQPPSSTIMRASKQKQPTLIPGEAADLSSHAELHLWACYLPPVMVWNDGVKSRLSPPRGEGKIGETKIAFMTMDHDQEDVSHGWNQFQVDALLEPVNPSIFEE